MIREMARALAKHQDGGDPDRIVLDAYGKPAGPNWESWVDDIKAVLEAAEPTQYMADSVACSAGNEKDSVVITAEGAKNVFRAMIHAALKELGG